MATETVKCNQFIYVWKIKNFSFIRNDDGIFTESFIPDNVTKSEYYFKIAIEDEQIMLFYFKFCGTLCDCCDSVYNCNFKLISIDGEHISSENKTMFCDKNLNTWEKSISHTDVMQNRNKYLIDDCLTIVFFTERKNPVPFTIFRIIENTVVHYEQKSFTWSMKEFRSNAVVERSFTLTQKQSNFTISLLPCDDDIDIIIANEKVPEFPIFMAIDIFLLDSSGNKRKLKMHEYEFGQENKTCIVFPSFLTKSKLIAENLNDIISIHCQLKYNGKKDGTVVFSTTLDYEYREVLDNNNSKNSSGIKKNIPLSALEDDLSRMYMTKEMTDVTFNIEGKTILAHKFVLILRSPVFSSMFKQDMLESKKGVIDIQDMDFETFDAMLSFMYGAKLDGMKFETIKKLFIAADKYQILSLQEYCSSFLRGCLSVTNVCDILILSDTVNDNELQSSALECFCSHPKDILVSAEWKQLESNYCGLALYVIKQYALNMNTKN